MSIKIFDHALFSRKLCLAEWVGLILCLLFVTAVFLTPTYLERKATLERETERLKGAAQIVKESLSRSLDATNRALMNVSADIPRWRVQRQGWVAASRRLKAYSDAMPSVRSMLIVNANGDVVAQGSIDKVHLPIKFNVANMAYFQTIREHPTPGTLYVSAPFVSLAGAWTYNLSQAVFTQDGIFDGLVVATIDLEDYKLLLVSVRYVDDQFIALIHGQGMQIIVEAKHLTPQGTNVATPGSFFTQHMLSGRNSNVMTEAVPTAQTTRIGATLTVRPAALHMNQPLVILVGRDEKTMLKEWRSLVKGRLALL